MKDASRLRGLIFEQSQLISELRLIQKHLEDLDAEIGQMVEHCREGTILTSIPPVGPLQAAMIIAAIGSIGNFESAAKLKSYLDGPRSESRPVPPLSELTSRRVECAR